MPSQIHLQWSGAKDGTRFRTGVSLHSHTLHSRESLDCVEAAGAKSWWMREAVRKNLPSLRMPVDVILHPRRSVIDLEFAVLEREVGNVFRAIQSAAQKSLREKQKGAEGQAPFC